MLPEHPALYRLPCYCLLLNSRHSGDSRERCTVPFNARFPDTALTNPIDTKLCDLGGPCGLRELTVWSRFCDQRKSFSILRQIAFLSVRQGHRKFWSIDAAGGNERSLFELEDIENPSLSPDAKQVAFNFTKGGVINVATVSVTGGEPKQITYDKELAGWPSWSPDARFLAVEIKRGDDTHIAMIPSNGGEPIQLTFAPGQSWPNGWSPDGDKIVFAGARDGIWNLWWVSRSDKRTQQLTQNTKLNVYFRYPTWSPLGNRIVSEYSERTFM